MVDQIVLGDTLQKINASLNKRFEKDADLYISKQDEFEVKKLLCNNAFSAIVNMAVGKEIKPEIILKVIVRNAGLLIFFDAGKFQKELKPILENVRYESVTYMMEDVLNNNVYMGKDLRWILFMNYIRNINYTKRITYWDSKSYMLDMRERKELFRNLIQGVKEHEPDFDKRWEFIIQAIQEYKYLLSDNKLLVKLKNGLAKEDDKKLFKQICMEMSSPSVRDDMYDNMIIRTYVSYGNDAFDNAIKELKTGNSKYKQYTKAIVELISSKEEIDNIKSRFLAFYKLYHQPGLQVHIRKEMDRKVWKVVKRNSNLYQEFKKYIDKYMPEEDNVQYSKFAEVFSDVVSGEKAKSIAYRWANMEKNALKQSLKDAFLYEVGDYDDDMGKVIEWLFKHNQKRSPYNFQRICETVSDTLLKAGKIDSGVAKMVDKVLMENVLEYKVKGKCTKDYLAKYHFNEYKNQYSR